MKFPKEDSKTLKRLLLLLKPYKNKIILIFICMIASTGVNTLLPLISRSIMDDGFLKKDFKIVLLFSIASLMLILIGEGIGLLETKYRVYISAMMPYTLSKSAFKHLLKLKMKYFNNTNFAEIMNNINMDVGNVSRIADRSIFFIINQVFIIAGGIVGLLIVEWRLTLLVICLIPVKLIAVRYLARQRRYCFEEYMEANRKYSSWYGDTISGVKEIKLWGIDRIKTGRYIKMQREVINLNIKMAFVDKTNELSETLLFNIFTNLIYILGANIVFNGSLTIGGIFAFTTYSMYVMTPISAILNIGYYFSNILPSAKRLFEFLDMECEATKGEKPVRVRKEDIIGNIKFDGVSFSYNKGEQTLKNVSFEIKPGEKTAIIGSNGSGKTTILNLLLRFYSPDEGKIMLDGMDINRLSLRDYRNLISVVSQDLYLFDTSIRENIDITTRSEDLRINKASKESGAHDFIELLPQKYETRVGRNGANLSGGERQKIAMARAFARESKILVLDEATSNYDVKSEAYVNELLESKFKDRTVIAVTHRIRTLKQVDKIVFIEKGAIRDIGNHEELYMRDEIYRNIVCEYNGFKNQNRI